MNLRHNSQAKEKLFPQKIILWAIILCTFSPMILKSQGVQAYYQHPALSGDLLIFAAEGDLWTIPLSGGLARRLTTHSGEESHPVISPDGQTLAFTANYEGSTELYTMPINGGLPQRWTYEAENTIATTWTPQGEVVYTTNHYATLPVLQLVKINLQNKQRSRIPLSQASEASFDADGKTLYFVRPAYHRNVTKRYKGGTARKIWKFTEGAEEAVPLTADYSGESHNPMWWDGRIYFISDRDGIMNIYSISENGEDLQQHTQHDSFDIRDASLSAGKIVYQLGADLWLLDIARAKYQMIPIRLVSDLDQLREKWVQDPEEYITSVNLHPDGKQLVITARGRVFVAPVNAGRLVQLSRKEGVRYRDATFMPNGKDILVLSDETGELEFVRIPATGIGDHEALTNDGKILRFAGVPSPNGEWMVYTDNNRDLWLLNIKSKAQKVISTNREGASQMAWSPDSRWVVFVQRAYNSFSQLQLYGLEEASLTALTSDRTNSLSPAWSHDGKWLYFLSDRNFQSLVGSPWGARQPEPYFDRKMKIYELAMQKGLRSPFRPMDELFEPEKKKEQKEEDEPVVPPVEVAVEGIQRRIREVPVKAGNYAALAANKKTLYWTSSETGLEAKTYLMSLEISHKKPEVHTLLRDVRLFKLAAKGEKMLIRKGASLYVLDAGRDSFSSLGKYKVDLSAWSFSLDVREDWRQLFKDAWRLERDYFYDPGMHGLDWDAMYQKYLPLVDRVTTRAELSDLIGRYVGELSALHTSVRGGDVREGTDNISIASLGARLLRDEQAGGYRIDYIYQGDPEYPNELSPLDDPELGIGVGDVIEEINGVPTLSVADIGALLRNQGKKQLRIKVKSQTSGSSQELILLAMNNEANLRYSDWEYSRRLEVEEKSEDKIGYVHLRAMGSRDVSQWYREFYPVFDRQGLIIDVRNNKGGNIDSFILEKLMRQAWFYWKRRVGKPTWNMQYAFRGYMVVLCDENTASDGEAFADGFRRLGLGQVIGTRTWGGEIWLSGINRLSDGGIARAPMLGVYGPEGEWLIEGHGLVPDIEVINLPHASFKGKDAQLEAAIQHLLEAIEKDPRNVPVPPAYPDKSFR